MVLFRRGCEACRFTALLQNCIITRANAKLAVDAQQIFWKRRLAARQTIMSPLFIKLHHKGRTSSCSLFPSKVYFLLRHTVVLEVLYISLCCDVSKWIRTSCSEPSVCSLTKSCVRWEPITQHASVPQVEQEDLGCRRNQSQWNPAGLRCFDAVCALLGRFLPQLLAVICMHSGRRFVLQRRIWPKYNFKAAAPPSVSSASRIFAEMEAFICVCCCVTLGLLRLCTFWRILQFSSGLFACVSISIRQVSVHRCGGAEQQQQQSIQTVPLMHVGIKTRLHVQINSKVFVCKFWIKGTEKIWTWNKQKLFNSLVN